MKLCEMTFTISKSGTLKIPAALLSEMGLSAGEHIRIAYLTDNESNNTFKEFLLYSDTVVDCEGEQSIAIPSSLLQQANIPSDTDIQIACLDGVLIIGTESKLNLNELSFVLEDLSEAANITEDLPSDTTALQLQIREIIDNLRREYES